MNFFRVNILHHFYQVIKGENTEDPQKKGLINAFSVAQSIHFWSRKQSPQHMWKKRGTCSSTLSVEAVCKIHSHLWRQFFWKNVIYDSPSSEKTFFQRTQLAGDDMVLWIPTLIILLSINEWILNVSSQLAIDSSLEVRLSAAFNKLWGGTLVRLCQH